MDGTRDGRCHGSRHPRFVRTDSALDDRRIPTGSSGPRARTSPNGLSARELEVLRLLAAGKTNRAIAIELVLSERTVSHHVASILGELAVSTRSAATAWAVREHLVWSSRPRVLDWADPDQTSFSR